MEDKLTSRTQRSFQLSSSSGLVIANFYRANRPEPSASDVVYLCNKVKRASGLRALFISCIYRAHLFAARRMEFIVH